MEIDSRLATREDLFEIMALMKRISDNMSEEGYGAIDLPFDFNTLVVNVEAAIKNGLLWVAVRDTKAVGVLIMGISGVFWSLASFLSLWILYVVPEARNSRAGFKLLRFAVAESKKRALPIFFDANNSIEPERKSKLLKSQGFVPMGTMYVLEVGK